MPRRRGAFGAEKGSILGKRGGWIAEELNFS